VAAWLLKRKALVQNTSETLRKRSRIEWLGPLVSALLCLAFTCAGQAAQSVTLAWDANTELDVAGYRLYYGTASRSYDQSIDVQNVTTNAVGNLQEGTTYFFAVTAYSTSGLESDFSNEVSHTATNSLPGGWVPTIVSVRHYGSGVIMTWTSSPGQTYRVFYKSRLEEPQWTQASDVLSAVDSETTWSDDQPRNDGQGFYAVFLLGP